MNLNQVHAVITGGASGMGRASAEALVAEGAKVCIADMNREWGDETVEALGENAYFEQADVSDPRRAEEIVRGAVEKFGYVNVVINCAGVGSAKRILPREGGVFPIEEFRRVIDIDLVGTFNYICQGALAMSRAPENEEGERGVIISCTSLAYSHGQIGQAAYSAAKGGVQAMTLPIARELARVGIRINCIVPGLAYTHMTPPINGEDPANKDFVFPRRRGMPSEFATLALEIIRNVYMNGAAVPLDGALRFSPKW